MLKNLEVKMEILHNTVHKPLKDHPSVHIYEVIKNKNYSKLTNLKHR